MNRNIFLGMKLNEAEATALKLWAQNEGIDNKSTMMRRVFRKALRSMAPRDIFPAHIAEALNLPQEAQATA